MLLKGDKWCQNDIPWNSGKRPSTSLSKERHPHYSADLLCDYQRSCGRLTGTYGIQKYSIGMRGIPEQSDVRTIITPSPTQFLQRLRSAGCQFKNLLPLIISPDFRLILSVLMKFIGKRVISAFLMKSGTSWRKLWSIIWVLSSWIVSRKIYC